jgi:hypothetical protein
MTVERLPEGQQWQYELRLDGYRAIGLTRENKARLWSRNGKDFVRRFPKVPKAIANLPQDTANRWRDLLTRGVSHRNDLGRPGNERSAASVYTFPESTRSGVAGAGALAVCSFSQKQPSSNQAGRY